MSGTIQQFDLVKPMDIMYSSIEVPGNPTDNPDNWGTVSTEQTIWIAIRTIKNGQPSPWDIVRTRGQDGTPGTIGQSTFKSTVFTRTNTAPGTPSGGSYASPVPTTSGWTDGVPSGSAKLWMSTRIFTSDGLTPQQTAWMAPMALTDNASLEVMFSSVATPGDPTSNPANWAATGYASSIWMATRTITNGVVSAWTVAKVKENPERMPLRLCSRRFCRDCLRLCRHSQIRRTWCIREKLSLPSKYGGGTNKLAFGPDWVFSGNEYTNIIIGQVYPTSTLYVSSITALSGYVDLNIRVGSSTYLTKRFNAAKVLDGTNGEPGSNGTPGVSMMLTNDSHSVMCDSSGVPLAGELGTSGKAITEIKVYLGGSLKTYNTDWQFLTSQGVGVTWGQISGQPKIYINSMTAQSGYVDINIQLLGCSTYETVLCFKKHYRNTGFARLYR